MDVGHIDGATLNIGVLSYFISISFYCYLFNLSLYFPSLTLEAHCYDKLVLELVLFFCGFRDGFGKIQSREIRREE